MTDGTQLRKRLGASPGTRSADSDKFDEPGYTEITSPKVTEEKLMKEKEVARTSVLMIERSSLSNGILTLFAMLGLPVHAENKLLVFTLLMPVMALFQLILWWSLQVGYLEMEFLNQKLDDNEFTELFDKHVNYYNLNSIARSSSKPVLDLLGRGNDETSLQELTDIIVNESTFLDVGFYSMKDARDFVRKTQLTNLRLLTPSIFSVEGWEAVIEFNIDGRPSIWSESEKRKLDNSNDNDVVVKENNAVKKGDAKNGSSTSDRELERRTLESIKTNNHLVEKRKKKKSAYRVYIYNEFAAMYFAIFGILLYHFMLHTVVGNAFGVGDFLRHFFDVKNEYMMYGEQEKLLVTFYECIVCSALLIYGFGQFVCAKLVTSFNVFGSRSSGLSSFFGFFGEENQDSFEYLIFMFVLYGAMLFVYVIKFWTACLLGPEVYHWSDIFMEKKYINFEASGPFKWFSHPMYAVGYCANYISALIQGNVFMFCYAVVAQYMIMLFGRVVEAVFLERFYMKKKFRNGQKVKGF